MLTSLWVANTHSLLRHVWTNTHSLLRHVWSYSGTHGRCYAKITSCNLLSPTRKYAMCHLLLRADMVDATPCSLLFELLTHTHTRCYAMCELTYTRCYAMCDLIPRAHMVDAMPKSLHATCWRPLASTPCVIFFYVRTCSMLRHVDFSLNLLTDTRCYAMCTLVQHSKLKTKSQAQEVMKSRIPVLRIFLLDYTRISWPMKIWCWICIQNPHNVSFFKKPHVFKLLPFLVPEKRRHCTTQCRESSQNDRFLQ